MFRTLCSVCREGARFSDSSIHIYKMHNFNKKVLYLYHRASWSTQLTEYYFSQFFLLFLGQCEKSILDIFKSRAPVFSLLHLLPNHCQLLHEVLHRCLFPWLFCIQRKLGTQGWAERRPLSLCTLLLMVYHMSLNEFVPLLHRSKSLTAFSRPIFPFPYLYLQRK